MKDAEIKKAFEYCTFAEECDDCPLFKNCPSSLGMSQMALDLINRQQAEIEKQSQNIKVLVSDHRCLQQSFDNLKGLYQAEKEKVESTKSKSIYFAKELQKARTEINRVTALAAEWKDAAYTYADNIDKIKADAAEVVHGQWSYGYSGEKLGGTDATYDYLCSVCNEFAVEESNYCPNCGAKMDGKGADNG